MSGEMSMERRIRVVVAEDHRLFREALCATLREEDSIQIVGEASNGPQAMVVMSDLKPDVALFDTVLPGTDVIELVSLLKLKTPETKALMLTAAPDEWTILKAVRAGAKGYISKYSGISDLVKAIQAVHQGELWVERKMLAKFFEGNTNPNYHRAERDRRGRRLTPREREVLSFLTKGCTNKEIGLSLFISEKTVKCHLNSIFKKIKVTRRPQAILYAIKQGLG